MAERNDIGLSLHRITQWIITVCAAVIVFLAQDIYEGVKELKIGQVRLEAEVKQHGEDIKEMQSDIKELNKQKHP